LKENIIIALTLYLIAVNLFGIIMTVADKLKARKGRRRISENALMTVGAVGGALGMYAAMKAIRHKTRHMKFMVGFPLLIVTHITVIFLCFRFF